MSDAADFVNLTEDYIRIDGLPFEDGPSDWHHNESLNVELGHRSEKTESYIFQRADASPEWLGVVISIKPDAWEVTNIVHFPSSLHSFGHADADLRVVATADSKEGLDDE